ncbi:hypothetical protein R1sor_025618 [Riccia sorocarpa]|uniref:Uncharacterized protein n=1 Tax=Riccia sorocarpa TaxID=122646 RepID=A0ABD3GCC6_9MARC
MVSGPQDSIRVRLLLQPRITFRNGSSQALRQRGGLFAQVQLQRKKSTNVCLRMWRIQILLVERIWHGWISLIGTWLLAWPCFWSVCLAARIGSLPDPLIICSFGVSAIFLRGAACTVERTRNRPLASGALTSFQAVSFFALQLLLGTAFLPQLNNISRILGAIWIPLISAYPLMKRWTYWPQAFLGVMWSYGALFGWEAVHGGLDLSVVLPLYASGMSWTLVYDTIYAHQDKEDDQKIGVKSTALKFGDKTKIWLAGFSATCISSLTLAGANADLGVVASACHLAWQVYTVDTDNPADCSSKFASNKWFGAIVCGGIIAGKLMTRRS